MQPDDPGARADAAGPPQPKVSDLLAEIQALKDELAAAHRNAADQRAALQAEMDAVAAAGAALRSENAGLADSLDSEREQTKRLKRDLAAARAAKAGD